MSAVDTSAVTGSDLGAGSDQPLTAQEIQLLQRLLSDPFSFPQTYKTWLVSYLETSDMNLPISSIIGLSNLLGVAGIGGGTLGLFPAGIIMPFGGAAAPVGSKMCDGGGYDPTAEARLFAAIGYSYTPGSPAAGAPFNVPDFRGRSPVGVGAHPDVSALNMNDGLPVGSRTPIHNSRVNDPTHGHGVNDPGHGHNDSGHNHNVNAPNPSGAGAGSSGAVGEITAVSTGTSVGIANIQASHTGIGVNGAATGISVGPGGGGRPQDTPAFETCNFIIIS